MPAPSWPATALPYPDVEQALIDLLGTLNGGRVDTRTPPDLQSLPDFIRVERVGGADDGWTDHPRIDVDVFSPRAGTAYELAEKVRQMLLGCPQRVGSVVIDRATTEVGPRELPWSNEVRRYVATYTLSARR